jgi:hypothetical protein
VPNENSWDPGIAEGIIAVAKELPCQNTVSLLENRFTIGEIHVNAFFDPSKQRSYSCGTNCSNCVDPEAGYSPCLRQYHNFELIHKLEPEWKWRRFLRMIFPGLQQQHYWGRRRAGAALDSGVVTEPARPQPQATDTPSSPLAAFPFHARASRGTRRCREGPDVPACMSQNHAIFLLAVDWPGVCVGLAEFILMNSALDSGSTQCVGRRSSFRGC